MQPQMRHRLALTLLGGVHESHTGSGREWCRLQLLRNDAGRAIDSIQGGVGRVDDWPTAAIDLPKFAYGTESVCAK